MQNRILFPQSALDEWGVAGKIELAATELILLSEERRYKIEEAVYVAQEVSGGSDPHGLVGKVKSKATLEELGAELFEGSMILGDNAYDVVPGWAAEGSEPWNAYAASRGLGAQADSELDMLKRFSEA